MPTKKQVDALIKVNRDARLVTVSKFKEIVGARCQEAGIGRLRVEEVGEVWGSVHIRSASYKKTNFTEEERGVLKELRIPSAANFAMVLYQDIQKVVERIDAETVPREPVVGTPLGRLMVAATNAADWLCECESGTDQHERGVELRKAVTAVAEARRAT